MSSVCRNILGAFPYSVNSFLYALLVSLVRNPATALMHSEWHFGPTCLICLCMHQQAYSEPDMASCLTCCCNVVLVDIHALIESL